MEIEIKHSQGQCDPDCSLYCSDDCGCWCNLSVSKHGPGGMRNYSMIPGPNCPGAGKYKLSPVEDRENECPLQWFQHEDSTKQPGWDECISCGRFASCMNFPTKDECWKRFDKEQAAKGCEQ